MKRRILPVFISVLMAITVMPGIPGMGGEVHADSVIGKINGHEYTSYEKLVSELDSSRYKNGNATIEMKADWNAAASGKTGEDFDRALVIPEGCKAILYMDGHVMNRNRAFRNDTHRNGEVICMEDGSSLTVYGDFNGVGKDTKHPHVMLYTSPTSTKATQDYTSTGGTITGGCASYGGGGIQVKGKSTLTLNSVTIAGCGSFGTGAFGGNGGGIKLVDGNSKLIMNDSLIIGCYSETDGGGIYANDEPESIELNNTVIKMNYAKTDGGGIFANDEKISISGRNESQIHSNEAGRYGGGICDWAGEVSVSGIYIAGNNAKEKGGGIYCDDTGSSLSNLEISLNNSYRGAGVYINKDKNTISSCYISNNHASGSGGGVYVGENVHEGFAVEGKTVIRANRAPEKKQQNFYFSDNDPEDNRCDFRLTKGSDVRVGYCDTKNKDSIRVTDGDVNGTIKGSNCIQFLTPMNTGYHFTFNSAPNQRKIYYVKDGKDSSASGEPYEGPGDPVDVNPEDAINNPGDTGGYNTTKAGKVGTVGAGGGSGSTYDLIRGFTRHEETDGDSNDTATVFYYSDAFFDADPYTYNEHLATASLNMAYAGMYLRAQETPDERDRTGNYYYNRHAAARQFMADIGCEDQKIYVNDSNEKKPQTDSIGVTIASKELAKANGVKTGKILIPVAIRGGGYELEWASNGTLNNAWDMTEDGKEHEAKGFSKAADDVMTEIDTYIKKYGLEKEIKTGNVKFWVVGYSRAGATANITSKRLVEKYATGETGKNNQVFGYTCEAPMGGTDTAEKLENKGKYYCIHNLINAVDIVPLVAPQLMGFKRYGVDHYIPGEEEFSAGPKKSTLNTSKRSGGGPDTATTYRDNDYIKIKTADTALKKKMLTQLKAVDSGIVFDDYFHPMAMDFAPSKKFYENGGYDGNDVEAFIRDFMRFAQEGLSPEMDAGNTQAISSRAHYVAFVQQALRDTFALVMTMDASSSQGFIGRAGSIMDTMGTVSGDVSKISLYWRGICNWRNQSEEEKSTLLTNLWKEIEKTGAFDFLSESDKSKMEKNWPNLGNMLFTLVNGDYIYKPSLWDEGKTWAKGSNESSMLLGTFATFSTYILQNHYPEVNMAWARAYDSYYENETKEYETLYQEKAVKAGYKVAIPAAFGKKTVTTGEGDAQQTEEQDVKLDEGADMTNRLVGDQKIILENEEIVGEAVYYDLEDTTNENSPKQLTTHLLYRGGVDLKLGTELKKSYRITAYDMSYGVKSDKAVYNIDLINDKHKVTVDNGSGTTGTNPKDYMYKEKDKVTVTADPTEDKYFTNWTVTLLDADGNEVADVTEALLGTGDQSEAEKATATFTMPEASKDKYDETNAYPEGYALKVTAECADRIKKINASPDVPAAGQELAEQAELIFDNGKSGIYPISWTYTYDDNGVTKTVPASGIAYNDTVYTATITVPQDLANAIVFAPVLEGKTQTGNTISVTRNNADGSATIVIEFEPTGDEGQVRPEVEIKLTVNAYDLNLKGYDESAEKEYHVIQNTEVTLTAQDVEDEMFVTWDLGNSGITLSQGYKLTDRTIKATIPSGLTVDELSIDAQYTPVINKITAVIEQPVADSEMQMNATAETLKVKITNEYEIAPDNVKIEWSPASLDGEDGKKIADYLIPYTATISIVPDENDKVYARLAGTTDDYMPTSATFFYSESVTATINGETVPVNKDNNSISYTFPMTKYTLVAVEQPADISGVEHGAGADVIQTLLPTSLKLTLNDGTEVDWPVTWTLEENNPGDPREEALWTATAKFVYEEGIKDMIDDPDELLNSVEVSVKVNEAATARAPESTLESGTYFYNQQTTLITNEDGGTTYYAIGNGEFTEYDVDDENRGTIYIDRNDPGVVPEMMVVGYNEEGEPIEEPTGRMMFLLKAKTTKAGMWDSAVVTYKYVFDNEIPVPNTADFEYDGEPWPGVSSTEFYEVVDVSDGAMINDDGDAIATNAGTYKVTVSIKNGYKWAIDKYEKTADTEVDPKKTYYEKDEEGAYNIVTPGSDENPAEMGWYEKETSEDDQTVEFTIHPADITKVAKVTAEGKFKTIDDLKKALKVEPTGNLKPEEGRDYDITYGEVKDGKVTVTVTGKGNYAGTITSTFIIGANDPDKAKYTITLELNGGELNGATGIITEEYYEGTVITLPKPSRKGYTFNYWKGSKYKAGDKYTVKENHTFAAQWNKKSGASDSDSDKSGKGTRTGDDTPLLLYVMLLITSGAILALLALLRRRGRFTQDDAND